jgi:hypothetical protein
MNDTPSSTEIHRILGNLASMPGYTCTTDKNTARAVLEHETVFCCGYLCDIMVKSRGLGIYNVFAKKQS